MFILVHENNICWCMNLEIDICFSYELLVQIENATNKNLIKAMQLLFNSCEVHSNSTHVVRPVMILAAPLGVTKVFMLLCVDTKCFQRCILKVSCCSVKGLQIVCEVEKGNDAK